MVKRFFAVLCLANPAYECVQDSGKHPGDLHRLHSTDPDVMMPEPGRKTVHTERLDLLRAWITAMK